MKSVIESKFLRRWFVPLLVLGSVLQNSLLAAQPQITVLNAWYGSDRDNLYMEQRKNAPGNYLETWAEKIWTTQKISQVPVIVKLRHVVAKYGFIAIPAAMNVFYGYDPLYGVAKQTAIHIKDGTLEQHLRYNEGADNFYPTNTDPAKAAQALSELKSGKDPRNTRPISYGDIIYLTHPGSGNGSFLTATPNMKYAPWQAGVSSGQYKVFMNISRYDNTTLWQVLGAFGSDLNSLIGKPVKNGDVIRLRNLEINRNLHSHSGFKSPVTGQGEATVFDGAETGDASDNWKVESTGDLMAETNFKLIHVNTNSALHSHLLYYPGTTQQEVTAYSGRDNNDFFQAWRPAFIKETASGAAAGGVSAALSVAVGAEYSAQMNKAISQQGDILEQSSSLLWGTAGTSVYFRLGINNNNPIGSGWTKVNGQMVQIACSEDGDVWGLKPDGTLAFRKEVSRDNIIGFDWEEIDTPAGTTGSFARGTAEAMTSAAAIALRTATALSMAAVGVAGDASKFAISAMGSGQIAVGADIVILRGNDNSLHTRDGITEGNRKGTAWRQIDQPGSIKHIAISETGRIWAVNASNQAVIRTGITPDAPLGTAWQVIEGLPEQASKVAVGANSVWVLAGKAAGGNALYFRFGVSDAKPQGDRWVKVDGGLVDHSVSAQGQLWGTNDAGDIFFRDGIVEGDPIGKAWKGIPGKLNTIAGGHDMRLVLAPKDFIREFGKASSLGVGSKDGECLAWAVNATQDKVLSYNQYSPAVNPWVEESILSSTGQALTTPFMGISVSSDGVILLLDGNKKVYRYNWDKKNFDLLKDGEAAAVKFESIAAGNKDALFAADHDTNTLYKYDEATGWKIYQKGNSSFVSAAVDGTVVILNEGGQAQMETAPGSGKWKQLGDLALDSIAVGSKDIVWGISETIFYHWINGAWEKVPEKPRDINPDKPVTIANFIPRPAQGMNGLAVNGANTCFVWAVNGDIFHNEEKGVQVIKTEPTKPGEAPKVEVKPTEPTKETRVQLDKKGRLNIRRSRSTSVSSRRDISRRLSVKETSKKAGKKAGKKAAAKGGLIKPGMDKPAGETPEAKGAGKKAAEKAGKKPGQKPGKKAARKPATKKVEETITEINESQEATSEETTQTMEVGTPQPTTTSSTTSSSSQSSSTTAK